MNQEEKDGKFIELITKIKGVESPENILILLDDSGRSDIMKKIIVAWNKIEIKRTEKLKSKNGDEWKWLWDQISYDLKELTEIVGKEIKSEYMKILIGNRLIYPDGTVSGFALNLIKKEIKDKIGI